MRALRKLTKTIIILRSDLVRTLKGRRGGDQGSEKSGKS